MLLLTRLKMCKYCFKIKEFNKFVRNKSCKYNIENKCKKCKIDYDKEYVNKNIDKLKTYRKEYRNNNKDKNSEYQKEYRETNKEQIVAYQTNYRKENAHKRKAYEENNIEKLKNKRKEYYDNNKEQKRIYSKIYRKENSNKIRIAQKQWRYDNREEIIKTSADYRDENRERLTKNQIKYRLDNKDNTHYISIQSKARIKRRAKINDTISDVTSKQIKNIIDKSNNICYWCNNDINGTPHIDHYIPISKGGENTISNMVVSCKKCNLTKSAKNPLEFANSIGKLL